MRHVGIIEIPVVLEVDGNLSSFGAFDALVEKIGESGTTLLQTWATCVEGLDGESVEVKVEQFRLWQPTFRLAPELKAVE